MKKLFFLILLTCSSVFAESSVVLPPVIDNSTYQSSSANNSKQPSANALYELLGRMEQMQAEIQQLRGTVEDQSQTIFNLKQRQGNIYSDLDQRIQELTATATPTALDPNESNQNGIDNYSARTAEQNIVEPATSTINNNSQEDIAPPVANQKEIYETALETLRNGHNVRAITAFKSLLNDFPEGEYADNSQFWLAAAYKANQDKNAAKVAFTKLITQYGASSKVPNALLQLGYLALEKNNNAQAKDYLTKVTVNFPGTTAAHFAKKKLISMGVMQP